MVEAAREHVLTREFLIETLDNLPTPVYVKDENACFIASNFAHCELIGLSMSELLGKSDFDFHSKELADDFSKIDLEILQTGEPVVREEFVVDARTGLQKVVLTRKARIQGADGKYYIVGTNSDLTGVRQKENQYRALTETVPVGVAQIDEAFDISFSNPLFNAYCGGDGTEADRERLISKLRIANPSFPGQACKFESTVQGLGNQPRTMIVISSGWLELGGLAKSATISLIDISQMTELQRINEDVSRLNAELADNMRKLNAAQDTLVKRGRMEQLGQLTATVAHELRNPLGAVRTSAFLLERKVKDKNLGVETQLDRINKGIVRCDNIITQLLDFSRTSQLNCEPGDLDSWLTQIIEEEAKKLPQRIELELTLGLDHLLVPFDPSRLQRAVINMVSNAVEAMPAETDGGAQHSPRIVISTYVKSNFISVRVSDNGPGIAPEVLDRIREPLFTTKSFGTGLGVPAIEQIAVQHGGRMDVRSTVGVGSTFTIWLPLQRADDESQQSAA